RRRSAHSTLTLLLTLTRVKCRILHLHRSATKRATSRSVAFSAEIRKGSRGRNWVMEITAESVHMELLFELIPMLDASVIEAGLRQLPPQQLRTAIAHFLPQGATKDDRISAIEDVLRSPAGQSLRDAMARWIVDEIVPVERL